ncbi:MAG TPA: hypothetical protein DCS07_18165 [Bdellovibrionales bacterium]|nr:MAG: hypothetical protein A2Z97_01920 [Bdellovibrionales bacterium GWB1_52_6]OFZ04898.1 MAG: hypothetical protein A2X97_16155 [Bdellovibrionales bacterium GWA1_52_35]OFZ40439.1 MAG: hypothetical protein A2070_02235 [Bdellovibrionales bacterium GWC1_52_8]HAR44528.1 hypothetical protein [Bdellovibrionales bacterium]HCM38830.1 hypothetical protein [Bdellovibrionales bacterium]
MLNYRFRVDLFIAALLLPIAAFAETPMGPSLVIGVPHPINLAFDSRSAPDFSWGAALGSFVIPPRNYITAGIGNLDFRARWHPYSGSFFLGGIFGFQSIFGKASKTIAVSPELGIPTTIDLTVASAYLTPHLGWIWTFSSGFTFGFEAGLQIPFSARSTLNVNISDPELNSYLSVLKLTPAYIQLQSEIENGANKIGLLKFPYSIFRFGWMF